MVTVYIISHKLFEISLLSNLLCIAKLKRLPEPKMQVNTNQYLFLPCVLSKSRFPLSSLCTDPPPPPPVMLNRRRGPFSEFWARDF